MLTCVFRILEPLLGLLWPAAGRHRSAEMQPMPTSAPRLPRVPALSGEDLGLVRPYLVAHERRQGALLDVRQPSHSAPAARRRVMRTDPPNPADG